MKPWYTSKTIWTNVIAFAASISTAFGVDLGLDAETQLAIVGGCVAVANVVLRVITTDRVTA